MSRPPEKPRITLHLDEARRGRETDGRLWDRVDEAWAALPPEVKPSSIFLQSFEGTLFRLASVREEIAALEEWKKVLEAPLLAAYQAAGLDEVVSEGVSFLRIRTPRHTIDRDALLLSGVAPSVLSACTRTTEASYIQARVQGEEGSGGGKKGKKDKKKGGV